MINKRILLAANSAIGSVPSRPAPLWHKRIRPDRSRSSFHSWPAALWILSRDRSDNSFVLLGQPVVIDNGPGGGTTIALKAIATSEPDGYTLLLGSTGR